jgi:hypothetical protein
VGTASGASIGPEDGAEPAGGIGPTEDAEPLGNAGPHFHLSRPATPQDGERAGFVGPHRVNVEFGSLGLGGLPPPVAAPHASAPERETPGAGRMVRVSSARVRANNDAVLALLRRLEAVRDRIGP